MSGSGHLYMQEVRTAASLISASGTKRPYITPWGARVVSYLASSSSIRVHLSSVQLRRYPDANDDPRGTSRRRTAVIRVMSCFFYTCERASVLGSTSHFLIDWAPLVIQLSVTFELRYVTFKFIAFYCGLDCGFPTATHIGSLPYISQLFCPHVLG
ncbi:hypothetical protein OE88DRAFT_1407506 [Heliocybe sulcata]|uniref:Uncharacterized protein n=1 Tax=Heliocybe sulcata TaxID=5364 RepID=A0A5C3N4B8_9AGAM|nr:hypothetical protein OE88DRAFT_1407506 [Heliocybe sulcata]